MQTVQEFLGVLTAKAARELEAAFLSLPEDKRNTALLDGTRTAANQVAECAVMNRSTVLLLQTRVFPDASVYGEFQAEMERLATDWPALQSELHAQTEAVIAAIHATPTEDLEVVVQSPWRPLTLSDVASYPYWNMTYHLGQINFMASALGG